VGCHQLNLARRSNRLIDQSIRGRLLEPCFQACVRRWPHHSGREARCLHGEQCLIWLRSLTCALPCQASSTSLPMSGSSKCHSFLRLCFECTTELTAPQHGQIAQGSRKSSAFVGLRPRLHLDRWTVRAYVFQRISICADWRQKCALSATQARWRNHAPYPQGLLNICISKRSRRKEGNFGRGRTMGCRCEQNT
jgi:hypothetical protein